MHQLIRLRFSPKFACVLLAIAVFSKSEINCKIDQHEYRKMNFYNRTCRNEYDVFKKWIKCQRVYGDRDLSALSENLNDEFLDLFKNRYEQGIAFLGETSPYLKTLTNGKINEIGYSLKPPMSNEMKENLARVYKSIDKTPALFIESLKTSGFASEKINEEEESKSKNFNETIEKYKALTRAIFAQKNTFSEDECLFAFANRMFEYCFEPATFPHYREILLEHSFAPISRFLQGIIWYYLIGDGWKHWHKNTLESIKQKHDDGHEIVYIAGGNDLLQLLKNGIYNIRVVDPFLPPQARYYSKGWEWLIKGKKNDEITCDFSDKRIVLRRTSIEDGEDFWARLSSDKFIELKKCETKWTIYEADNNKEVGTLTFDRRCVTQKDMELKEKKVLLASYDELIYQALPNMLDGWGIDTKKISPEQKIYVKQFRKPIDVNVLNNMKVAALINFAHLRFINFASDPR